MANPPAIFLDIDGAMRSGDTARAIALARQALDSGLSDPVLFSLRGYWHEANDRFEAASIDLAKASALAPSDGRILVSLARCLSKLGRCTDALILLEQALRLLPAMAAAHYEKGFALEQTGALLPARTSYAQAWALAPDMANAAARLASLAARRSDWPEAERLANAALALDPHDAVAKFALVMKDMAHKAYAGAEGRARQVADAPGTHSQARAHALSFLADALDAQDRPAEAFGAYAESNAMMRAIFHGWFDGVESGLSMATRIVRTLNAQPPHLRPPSQQPAPVFLIGFARAGTSLLGQILAGHSRVVSLEEKPLFGEALDRFFFRPQGLQELESLSDAEAERYRALYWHNVRRQFGGDPAAKLVVDQTPLNTLHLPLIARLFPAAKILFAIRDPRDVVLSCFRRQFTMHRYTFEFLSLDRTAQFYDATMQIQALARHKLDLDFCDIRNEDLVADFDGEMRRVCDWMNLTWEPSLADFAKASRARGVATPSATQIARGLNADGIGQWRRYEAQMQPVLPLLAPWVEQFGYARDSEA